MHEPAQIKIREFVLFELAFYFEGGDKMTSPLNGIKVLDLSRVLAGPYCTMILGDLGAEVIKVESEKKIDETRTWGPPYKKDVSAYYLTANRNKKAVTINLKTADGKHIIKNLIKDSDVVVHNFKTGTMERLGLSYEVLSEINPQLIYCSITGFGETGPKKDSPGYDFIIQAMSGLMSITGNEKSGPQKSGVAITDVLTGLYATIGIQAALLERHVSGKGQKLDLALYDSAVSALVNIGSNYLMSGEIPERMGNTHANIVPYQTFQTANSEIVIAIGNNQQFKRFSKIINLPELALNEKYSTNSARVEHREELVTMIQKELVKETTNYWEDACAKANIPLGEIQTLDKVFEDEQLKAREMFIAYEHPIIGKTKMIGSPLKLSRTPVQYKYYPPSLGEHQTEIIKKYEE